MPRGPLSENVGLGVSASPRTYDRRRLLALGSGIALGPWLGGLVVAATEIAMPPLSVGYLRGSDRLVSLDRLGWLADPDLFEDALRLELGSLEIDPAHRLPAGDPAFGWELAEITVHGLYPGLPEGAVGTLRRAALEVWYPSPDPAFATKLPSLVWSYSRAPVLNVGSANRFVAPVDRDSGLELTLEVESASPASFGTDSLTRKRTFHTTFSVNLESDRPKLQRGVYLLGFEGDAWSRSRKLLSPADRRSQRLLSLILSVDHVRGTA